MLILAVEQSCCASSAVISDDTEVLASVNWIESRLRSQLFFPSVEKILEQSKCSLENIEVFAAGTGPGAFNALRMSLSSLQAFSLPGKKTVFGVASPQALALQLHEDQGVSNISVVGDARRGSLWLANYTFKDSSLPCNSSIFLVKPGDLNSSLAKADIIASPDFERISSILADIPDRNSRLIDGPSCPHARFVAETAFACITQGESPPPFSPTYLHPAV